MKRSSDVVEEPALSEAEGTPTRSTLPVKYQGIFSRDSGWPAPCVFCKGRDTTSADGVRFRLCLEGARLHWLRQSSILHLLLVAQRFTAAIRSLFPATALTAVRPNPKRSISPHLRVPHVCRTCKRGTQPEATDVRYP